MWQVAWSEGAEYKKRRIKSIQELDAFLDGLHAKAEQEGCTDLVTVTWADYPDDWLQVGIGRELSVLHHVPDSPDVGYALSVGDPKKRGSIMFTIQDQPTEFKMRNAIPIALAREVVREFCRTRRLSDKIAWEEV